MTRALVEAVGPTGQVGRPGRSIGLPGPPTAPSSSGRLSWASLWWTVPIVIVVEVGAVFTGFGAVVPQMSFITTDFAREV